MAKRTRRQKAIIKRRIFLSCCALCLAAIIGILSFFAHSLLSPKDNSKNNNKDKNKNQSSSIQKEDGGKPTPNNDKTTTVTVLSTGDIMVHQKQLDGAYNPDTKQYDFNTFFAAVKPYLKDANLAVGNLEVTFGGTAGGNYRGYPSFNTPDSLADALKSAGFNFLLTANNHSYDTGLNGLVRTAKVLKEKGIEFTGTKETDSDPSFVVKNVSGIKIGMANYTYGLNGTNASNVSLINSFDANNIGSFYSDAQSKITEMKKQGAEFIVFYMHWGTEYKTSPNTLQKSIAQKLSNLGVDIIIGSHPHVIEPIELIHSEDGQNTTVCVYSTGNAVSNQRIEELNNQGHTEDGMLFYYTLEKKNGDVTLKSVDVIPTWVDRFEGKNGYQYTIYPLENENFGSTKWKLNSTAAQRAAKSYKRTEAILKSGLTEVQKHLGCEITFK